MTQATQTRAGHAPPIAALTSAGRGGDEPLTQRIRMVGESGTRESGQG
jgi:hypothetical protein